MSEGPWYKITFDPRLPGTAKVLRPGRKGHAVVPGRWVVFDKNKVPKGSWTYQTGDGSLLYSCISSHEANAWIDAQMMGVTS